MSRAMDRVWRLLLRWSWAIVLIPVLLLALYVALGVGSGMLEGARG